MGNARTLPLPMGPLAGAGKIFLRGTRRAWLDEGDQNSGVSNVKVRALGLRQLAPKKNEKPMSLHEDGP